jgi:SNF2 family DNA or RNA helicase
VNLQAGKIARVRTRKYLIEEVVPPPVTGDQTLVRLACLEDDAQGQPLEVLWEREVDAKILDDASWAKVAEKGFDPPNIFSAYLHTLRWNCVTSIDPKLFQSPYRAGIKVDAYQLDPLRKALRLPRVNLFIADDVGLGKTIEAGLILREMILRQKVRRVVVAAPPSIVPQWKDELERRFGLIFAVFNRDYVLRARRERGYSVNPWTTHSRFIISHALLRDETYAASLRDWLGDFSPGSLLILDEAHNAAPASDTSRYAVDSDFTKAVRDIAPRFEHRLFLSATPHNGHSNSFSALLEILDPQRFCRGVKIGDSKRLQEVMVRRLKDDLREVVDGIPKRNVIQVDIDGLPAEAPELRLAALLDQYSELRKERLKQASKRTQATSALVITNLQKRLLSCVEAFAFTLEVHRKALGRQLEKSAEADPRAENLSLLASAPGSNDDRAELTEDQVAAEEEAQMDAATVASSAATSFGERASLQREIALVDQMREIAQACRFQPDAKVRWIVDWIRENLCTEVPRIGEEPKARATPHWAPRRLLIFTEYADTKRYLQSQLAAHISQVDPLMSRIAVFHGGMGDEKREAVKAAFNADPERDPLRILIATDAAREGVNLQNFCSNLMHFDVPWNPSRMEQRNGRIDRKLQRETEVRCYYFVYAQRPEDRVIATLVRKTKTIQKELGSLSPVIELRLGKLLEKGIARKEIPKIEREIEAEGADPERQAVINEELESTRERKEQLGADLEVLRGMLATSRSYLGLDEANFINAISSALKVSGFDPITRVQDGSSDDRPRFAFPDLASREGADPTWAETIDTLREPLKRGENPWEFREKPLRPIVFNDPGVIDDSVVHLHLEHRVVQRLLNRFLAQGFVHDDLSRACVGQSDDAIPRVIVLGRLSLYGTHAARLHDEIVPIAAQWSDPQRRTAPLRPYAAVTEARTLDLLETSISGPRASNVPTTVQEKLLATVSRDVSELLPSLETRAKEAASSAIEKLVKRGDQESRDMTLILENQRKQITATLGKVDGQQLSFGWTDEEKRQLENDKRHWQRRLIDLQRELETEPARIRASYQVKARRIEPVGVVYLWPISG